MISSSELPKLRNIPFSATITLCRFEDTQSTQSAYSARHIDIIQRPERMARFAGQSPRVYDQGKQRDKSRADRARNTHTHTHFTPSPSPFLIFRGKGPTGKVDLPVTDQQIPVFGPLHENCPACFVMQTPRIRRQGLIQIAQDGRFRVCTDPRQQSISRTCGTPAIQPGQRESCSLRVELLSRANLSTRVVRPLISRRLQSPNLNHPSWIQGAVACRARIIDKSTNPAD